MRENELRGKLLGFLDHIYPDPIDEGALIGVFYEYHEPEDIKRALQYLEDQGYVVRTQKPHPYREGRTVSLYRILPAGINLKAGNATDCGVTIVDW